MGEPLEPDADNAAGGKGSAAPSGPFFYFMELKINGQRMDVRAQTVQALLVELGIKTGMVAVEVNLNIVRKKDYAVSTLKAGDTVEIVNFVGGG
jgi:sulfur carrier protein